MPFGLGRKIQQAASNVNENYVMPVVREAGRQIFHPEDINSMPVEKRPMQAYDFVSQDERYKNYPNAPVDVPPPLPKPGVPMDWYRNYRMR